MNLSAPIFRLRREARARSKAENLPLHAALDAVARREGFTGWSHLARQSARAAPGGEPEDLYDRLGPGEMVLLGARPGHGKTLLGLSLLARAVAADRPAFFFTLEYHAEQVVDRLRALGIDPASLSRHLTLDTSDGICAEYIAAAMETASRPALAVVDYLQLLDQRRETPPLGDQVAQLRALARRSGATFVMIAQIDRRFDQAGRDIPGARDIRLPNPLDLRLFDRMCFLHGGRIRVDPAG
ncbi:MAG: DNA helicase [Pseudomonadota bacterium]